MSEETMNSTVTAVEGEAVEQKAPKRKFVINQDNMTLGDMELFEDVTGMSMGDAFKSVPVINPETGKAFPDPNDPKGRPLMTVQMTMKTMVAMLFINLRQEDPNITIEDVRKMKLSDFELEVEENVDPTSPSENAPSENA